MEERERDFEEVSKGVRALGGLRFLFTCANEQHPTGETWDEAFAALDVVHRNLSERVDRLQATRPATQNAPTTVKAPFALTDMPDGIGRELGELRGIAALLRQSTASGIPFEGQEPEDVALLAITAIERLDAKVHEVEAAQMRERREAREQRAAD